MKATYKKVQRAETNFTPPNLVMEVRISTRGRITIPAEIRELIGLKPGGIVRFDPTENGKIKISVKKTSNEFQSKQLASKHG
jgi:AbrB family looped-hinge helix DNA binding protein